MNIGFIGAGQMAQALATGMVANGSDDQPKIQFWIGDPKPDALQAFSDRIDGRNQVHSTDDNSEVVRNSDLLFLAVKPQFLQQALRGLHISLSQSSNPALTISIVAGISLGELGRMLKTERIVRVMPNTPCLIGQGVLGLCAGTGVGPSEIESLIKLLNGVGDVFQVSEDNLDAVTGLSGSGPAFVFTFLEALTDAGVLNGLPRDVAFQLAIKTVLGSIELMRYSGEHPAVLRDRVTSPGGTTIAGIKALEETGFRDAVMSAVTAATERSIEIGG